jgi:hypothetical protein
LARRATLFLAGLEVCTKPENAERAKRFVKAAWPALRGGLLALDPDVHGRPFGGDWAPPFREWAERIDFKKKL